MPLTFSALPNPSGDACDALERLGAANPFWTRAYTLAMCELGLRPWFLGLWDGPTLTAGCPAFLRVGRLNRRLEIPSVADVAGRPEFWAGFEHFCRREGITAIQLDGYAWTTPVRFPPLPGEISRRLRCEYIIGLRDWCGPKSLRSGHRYEVNRARKAGVTVVRSRDQAALRRHVSLMEDSMARRRQRGQNVPPGVDSAMPRAYLHTGAGELFQGMLGNRAVTSMLILRSSRGAYDQTNGTSPEGMRCGASHLLTCELAAILKDEGCAYLDLGGAGDDSGLAYFKTGFGARPVEQESLEAYLGGALRKKLTATAGLRDRAAKLWRAFRRRVRPLQTA